MSYYGVNFTSHGHDAANYVCQKANRQQAVSTLQQAPEGSWMHRESRFENCTALSVNENGKINHRLIKKIGNAWYQMDQEKNAPCSGPQTFEALLRSLGANPRLQQMNRPPQEEPVPPEAHLEGPLFRPLSKEEALQMLNGKSPGTYLFRPSEQDDQHIALSYVDSDSKIVHQRLTKSLGVDGEPHRYVSLQHFVNCHPVTLKVPCEVFLPAKTNSALEGEFNRLPQNMEDFTKCTYAQKYIPLNRFSNVLPFNENAFKGKGFYYNGSILFDNKAIACQGPVKNCVDNFWKMAWQSTTGTIVMLTKTEECCQYWPAPGETATFGPISVKGIAEKIEGNLITRTCQIENLDEECSPRQVTLVQYTGWPDHGTADPKELVKIIRKIEGTYEKDKPITVHCRAGIGRTGTLLAALFTHQRIKEDPAKAANAYAEVATEIRSGRIGAIQSAEQYICGYRTVEELLK